MKRIFEKIMTFFNKIGKFLKKIATNIVLFLIYVFSYNQKK